MFQGLSTVNPPATLSLGRLYILRNTAIICGLCVAVIASTILSINLPITQLFIIISIHALINIISYKISHDKLVSSFAFFLHLVWDTLIFSALLYYSGGSTNPFVSLFLLPLVIAASLLPQHYTWMMASITLGCYSFLMFFYQPLSHTEISGIIDFDLHVLGMWFGFLLSTCLIVFFMVRMANSLRARDKMLIEKNEQALKNKHLVALGTLATGAAHELSTPLSTMAVLTGELLHDKTNDPGVTKTAELLKSQIKRCKNILSNITASAGQARPEASQNMTIDVYLKSVISLFKTYRPEANLTSCLEGNGPPPHILADKTLTQALCNLLNNAADASISFVKLTGRWDTKIITINILDKGSGLSSQVKAAAGPPFFTTKPDGQGLGLYLSRAVIEQFGGTIQMYDNKPTGVNVEINLPLSNIKIK